MNLKLIGLGALAVVAAIAVAMMSSGEKTGDRGAAQTATTTIKAADTAAKISTDSAAPAPAAAPVAGQTNAPRPAAFDAGLRAIDTSSDKP